MIVPPFMHFRFNYVDRPVYTSSSNKAPLDLSLSPRMLIPPRITVHRHLWGNEVCRSYEEGAKKEN